jgi:hypothetical protein
MTESNFLLIDRDYFREMARLLKLAHERLEGRCPCEFCAHAGKMGVPVEELPAT